MKSISLLVVLLTATLCWGKISSLKIKDTTISSVPNSQVFILEGTTRKVTIQDVAQFVGTALQADLKVLPSNLQSSTDSLAKSSTEEVMMDETQLKKLEKFTKLNNAKVFIGESGSGSYHIYVAGNKNLVLVVRQPGQI